MAPCNGFADVGPRLARPAVVASSPAGLTVQELAEAIKVHRSIAARLVSTLDDSHFVSRDPDNRYRAAGGLTALARNVYAGIRDVAIPVMHGLADRVGSSIALFVEEGRDAVAVCVAISAPKDVVDSSVDAMRAAAADVNALLR